MDEKMIIAQYTMYVYNTGEIRLIKEDDSSKDLSKCSSSIRQLIGIINYVVKNPGKHIHYRVTEAVNYIAQQENIRQASVHSKITKKLGLSMEDFKKLLEQYLNHENKELEKHLYAACVAKTKQADEIAIKKLILEINSRKEEKFYE